MQKKTPFLVPKIPFIRTWKEAIKQWDEGDPSTGLIPLSQWPLERQQSTRTYKDRQMIAQEFENFGRSEARMRKVYGSDMDGVAKLRDAIRAKHKKLYQPGGEMMEEGSEEEAGEEDEENDGDHNEQGGAQQEEAMEHGDDKPEVLNIPKVFHWKQVIRQWEDGDVRRGLTIPLRAWTKAMIQGDSTYYERQTVYREFEKFGFNEDKMREVYGDVIDGQMKHFMRAIRARNKAQRQEAKEGKQIARQQPVERDDNVVVDTPMLGVVAVIESEDDVERDTGDDQHDSDSRRTNPRSSSPRHSNPYNAHSLRDPDNPNDVSSQTVPRIRYWLEAVRQWEQGDPEHGLTVPIRDWPAEWRKEDKMRQVYGRRRAIAEEYELMGRDETRMRQVHGECLDRPNDLVLSIGRRRREKAQELAGAQSEERNDDEEDMDELEAEEGVEEDEGEDESLIRKRKSKAADGVETLSKKNKPSTRSSRSPCLE